jgi:hypothetical protein
MMESAMRLSHDHVRALKHSGVNTHGAQLSLCAYSQRPSPYRNSNCKVYRTTWCMFQFVWLVRHADSIAVCSFTQMHRALTWLSPTRLGRRHGDINHSAANTVTRHSSESGYWHTGKRMSYHNALYCHGLLSYQTIKMALTVSQSTTSPRRYSRRGQCLLVWLESSCDIAMLFFVPFLAHLFMATSTTLKLKRHANHGRVAQA